MRPTTTLKSNHVLSLDASASDVRTRVEFLGDHSGGGTPVPIPNTEVKSSTPMVVGKTARVGRCPVLNISGCRVFGRGSPIFLSWFRATAEESYRGSILPGCDDDLAEGISRLHALVRCMEFLQGVFRIDDGMDLSLLLQ